MKGARRTIPATFAALAATLLSAASHAATTPRVTVAATHLNAPKQLLAGARGVYVAESGTGGRDCVTSGHGPSATQYCEGLTASIALIAGGHARVVAGKLPSVRSGGEVSGPAAVAVTASGQVSILYQDTGLERSGGNPLPAPAGKLFGTFQISPTVSARLARFAAVHPQKRAALGGTTDETTYDSDPYDVVPYRGGYAIADAGANDLLFVKRGRVKLLARFPAEIETAPAGALGPAPVTVGAQAVPTSVAVGPGGALYVGLLRGAPSLPGTAQIYRIVPGHAPKVWARGLTAVTAISFDRRGRLLCTEYSKGGLLAPSNVAGALIRITGDGTKLDTLPVRLFDPTGVAVARSGAVFVSDYGAHGASARHPGEVVKITGLG
jgi:hypothetical protein